VRSPSTSPDARRSAVRSVAKRYHRAERAVSRLVALSVSGTFLLAFALADLLTALAVAAVLVVAMRAPVLRRRGTTRLRTDATPRAVVDEFASPTPPPLAFQWGVADEVRPTADRTGGVYEHSSLFGLRSHSLAVETAVETTSDDDRDDGAPVARVHVEGTLDGREWGAYSVVVREAGGETVVDVELLPRRRFGLRGLPQALVADAYYADALAAQGYAVVDRDVSFAASR
jgi:hypothetical protein